MKARRYRVRRPTMNDILIKELQPVSVTVGAVHFRRFRGVSARRAPGYLFFVRIAGGFRRRSERSPAYDEVSPCPGRLNRNVAPWGMFAVAHIRPPCASMIERQIDSPMPMPPGLVV